MISQEQIFKWIQEKDWWAIIEFLQKERPDRYSDPVLEMALNTFTSEFFASIDEIRKEEYRQGLLEDMYLMNSSNMFLLTKEEFETLILEMIKNLSLKDAYEYAKELPENSFCTTIVQKFENGETLKYEQDLITLSRFNINWKFLFNQWFNLINTYSNNLTYLSKPTFFKVCQRELSLFPSEESITKDRESKGKDMKRADLYFDILNELELEERFRIFKIFLKRIENHEVMEIGKMYEILGIGKPMINDETEQY